MCSAALLDFYLKHWGIEMSQWNLRGEVAAVIGGTGVLGGAMAQGLAEAGASVAVLGRDHDRGHKRVAAIEAAGGTGVFAACDATDKASLKQPMRRSSRRWVPSTCYSTQPAAISHR